MAKKESSNEKVSLNDLMAKINKKWGQGTVMRASEASGLSALPRILTGIFALDYASGGGIPVGRITSIFGKKSSAKSVLAAKIVAAAQGYCREHVVRMVSTGKRLYRCPACGARSENNGDDCPSCAKIGVESTFQDYGDTELQCPVCGEYNPFICAWLDAEGTYDNTWSAKLGINGEYIWVIRTEFAEQAIDVSDAMLRTGDCDILVIDTIAHLTPSKEIEDSSDQWNVGLQARLINKMLRKLVSAVNAPGVSEAKRPTVLMLNQIRNKVGCFNGKTRVRFADGRSVFIKDVVRDKMTGPVLCYTQEGVVERNITDWHDNGPSDDWVTVRVSGGKNGDRSVRATADHLFMTQRGYVAAKDLTAEDDVVVIGRRLYGDSRHKEFIFASLLGDGSLRFESPERGKLRFMHCSGQSDYVTWKAAMLGCSVSYDKNDRPWFDTPSSEEFQEYADLGSKKSRTSISQSWVDQITPFVAAVWYMDDGSLSGSYKKHRAGKCCISARKLSEDTLRRIASRMDLIGLGKPHAKQGVGLTWSGEEAEKFQRGIANNVIPSISYKIAPRIYADASFDDTVPECAPSNESYLARVVSVTRYDPSKPEDKRRYDITVDGAHNYFACGVLVHNCFYGDPEVRPGGLGQEFAPSMDIKMWASKYAQDDEGATVNLLVNFRVVKNKTAPPMQEGKFRLWLRDFGAYRPGYTEEREVLVWVGYKVGLFGAAPKWGYAGETFKNKDELHQHLLANPELFDTIRQDLMKIPNLGIIDGSTCKVDLGQAPATAGEDKEIVDED